MGGYGSGGHNRRKNYVGSSIKIDSFYFSKRLQNIELTGMDYLKGSISWGNGNEIEVNIFKGKLIISYTANLGSKKENISDTFVFERVKNNYGGAERIYFICPYCECRIRFLYLSGNNFKCRTCANLNYRSQQETKNTHLAAYKMEKFIRDKFKVTENLAPVDAVYYKPERPKGMHEKTYYNLLKQLYQLQEEYNTQFYVGAMRIIKHSLPTVYQR